MNTNDLLVAVQTLNTILKLGSEWVETAKHITEVIQYSIEKNEPIPQSEWDYIVDKADKSDAELSRVIKNHVQSEND